MGKQGANAWNAASRLPGTMKSKSFSWHVKPLLYVVTMLGLLADCPHSQPISPGDLEPPEDPEEFDPECH